jgi:hypothetical protein
VGAVQPFEVTVALKVPDWLTVIDDVVAPVLQTYVPAVVSSCSVTLPPVQKVVGPVALIEEPADLVTTLDEAVAEQLLLLVMVTV